MSAIRRRVATQACAVVVLCSAACASGQAAGAGPTEESSPLPGQAAECPEEPVDPVGPEHAAECVYRAWITDDEALERAYGAEGVTDVLPTVMDEPVMTFNGCAEGSGTVLTGLVCTWTGVNIQPDVTLEMALTGSPAEGFRVAEIHAVTDGVAP
ncbi:hypothetical protein QUV83_16490 [Cellulomonas cellasea]|uniref:hypothetical protein n=1 Tax=Cellulomonas cellasea TaxID=43670 RepID=UPI0025A31F3F|nr:hypothetical protein [Cellulomonas cellasea]MDM8086373.1 hypothetical protein [Cellulomonas cellasea]